MRNYIIKYSPWQDTMSSHSRELQDESLRAGGVTCGTLHKNGPKLCLQIQLLKSLWAFSNSDLSRLAYPNTSHEQRSQLLH
jgi:hypothetical protein